MDPIKPTQATPLPQIVINDLGEAVEVPVTIDDQAVISIRRFGLVSRLKSTPQQTPSEMAALLFDAGIAGTIEAEVVMTAAGKVDAEIEPVVNELAHKIGEYHRSLRQSVTAQRKAHP